MRTPAFNIPCVCSRCLDGLYAEAYHVRSLKDNIYKLGHRLRRGLPDKPQSQTPVDMSIVSKILL